MKRYAVCGVSNRAHSMFINPMVDIFSTEAELVALLDPDPLRFEDVFTTTPATKGTPVFRPEEFDRMVAETRPDVIIAGGRDCTHIDYVLQALENDLDVVTEKPMTTTAEDCRRALEAEKTSRGRIIVTFNYRYIPCHRKIKELVLTGRIGRVTHVDLNWYIDTYHGATYFKRWNRYRDQSGGLSIHKCTHHFDLVNWWIDQEPVDVSAFGALNYFGADGPHNPERVDGRHCATCESRSDCPYYRRWFGRSHDVAPTGDRGTSLNQVDGKYTDYRKDACIFDSDIEIEDTYVANIRYDGGALLNFSVNFSTPYEGYRLAINGTEGRIESQEYGGRTPWQRPEQTVDLIPLFGSKETIHVVNNEGGHGGGDPLLLEDIFLGTDPSMPFPIQATSRAGALAVATGEAVWRSSQEGKTLSVPELLGTTG